MCYLKIGECTLDKVLRKIQGWRYGNLGLALAAGGTIFTLTSVILQITGISGSILILFLDIYASTVLFFSIYLYLVDHQHKMEQQIGRKINQANQSLTIQRSRIIGVVAPLSYWSTEYYIEIIKAVRAAAEREQRGIRRKVMILDVPHEDFTEVEEILTDVITKDVSGLIVINMKINQGVKQELAEANIPVINIAHEDNKPPSVCSIVHDPIGFEDLLKHVLIEMKSTSAVLITVGLKNPFKGVSEDPFRKEKRELYIQTAVKAELLVQPSPVKLNELTDKLDLVPGKALIVEIDKYTSQEGLHLFEKLPDSAPRNTAFIFLADSVAIGFLLACQSEGLNARKRGFRVTGFDNTKLAEGFDLTSVDLKLDLVGRLVYERLQLALDRPDRFSYNQERVKGISVIRGSSNWQ
jgi:DNA-binding LacI/PurR family transcriptional regulator